jgi:predicted enzyme related to lactoylglutathione lyase
MPTRTEHAPGTPSWTDLATPDLDAAQAFYGALFGWDFDTRDTGSPENPYVMASQGGKATAGMMRLSPEMQAGGMPPVWSTYVTVADVDASAAKATELGGTVVQPAMDVMDAGRMAVLVDPAGAAICLWQARGSIGAELVNEPVSLTWNELMTPDVDAITPFYEGLFGWKRDDQSMGEGPPYTLWMLGDRGVAGGMVPPMPGMPSFWGVYFSVADADATAAKAQELGATVMSPPMDIPDVGRFAVLTDPQGATFNIMKNANPGD